MKRRTLQFLATSTVMLISAAGFAQDADDAAVADETRADDTGIDEISSYDGELLQFTYDASTATVSTTTLSSLDGPVQLVTVAPLNAAWGVIDGTSFLQFAIFPQPVRREALEDQPIELRALDVVISGVADGLGDVAQLDPQPTTFWFSGVELDSLEFAIDVGDAHFDVESASIAIPHEGDTASVVFYLQLHEGEDRQSDTLRAILATASTGPPAADTTTEEEAIDE